MGSRRNFIGTVAGGLAGTLASPAGVLGANDRVRLGLIGAGARGMQLLREALACPQTECVAVADVYTHRREQAALAVPNASIVTDYRRLLEVGDLDAVIVATPQHLHAEHFIGVVGAGKHVYLERSAARTLDDARQMHAAYRRARNAVVQIGHQSCSSGLMRDAIRFIDAGWLGRLTAIRAHMYRNTPAGKPQWRRPVYPDMTPETIDWQAFQGPGRERPFDAHRFVNWRYFDEYSGGNVHESMSQQLAFWTRALDLGIPDAVHMAGGVYLWDDGREAPDTMSVSLEYSGQFLFTWDSGFGNAQLGTGEYALGTDGTIFRGQQIRYWPEKVNRPEGRETMGRSRTDPRAHMQNFLDAVRGQMDVNCPFDIGYRVSIACWMAVESHRLGRRVRWDAETEQIV